MSIGSGIPAALIRGNREVLDAKNAQDPQAAILYLLQEASKLALPEARQDCPYSVAIGGIWSGERSEQNKRYHFPSGSSSAIQFSNDREHCTDPQQSFNGSASLKQPNSSPWEVMSLINRQCERLLHPENGEEGEADRLVAAPFFEGPQPAPGKEGDASPAAVQINAEGFGEALGSCSRENKSGITEKFGSNLGETETVQCNKYVAEGSLVRTQVTGITGRCDNAINANERGDQAIGSIQVAGTHFTGNSAVNDGSEDRLLNRRKEMPYSRGKGHGLCGSHCAPQLEPDMSILASMGRQERQQPESSSSAKADELVCSSSAFNSSHLGASPLPDRGVKMYCTSDPIPSVGPLQDVQSQRGPPAMSNNSNCESAAQNPVSPEGLLALPSEPNKALVQNMEEEQLKLKANRPACDLGWQARRPRKQSHPTRSADLCDPNFKGVTFRMRTELNDNRDQCRLLITSNYSAELLKSIRRVRGGRQRSFTNSLKTSSSEEDSDSSSLSKNKICASCNTKKTPLWRDAEDGTPLCNACGIRYKKYRVRCFQCWHIPRKEGNSDTKCYKCGDLLRLATSQRKLTGW